MKAIAFIVATIIMTDVLLAQGNVGIGTSNPSEKLEVNGNIMTSDNLLMENGNILASNGYGVQGQILGVNSSGNVQWQNANLHQYASFMCVGGSPINQSWIVPADVNEVEVLIWASGGSGAPTNDVQGGGGGSGAFIKAKLFTTPLDTIVIQVGCGNGQHSAVIYADTSLFAFGGQAGTSSSLGLGGGLAIDPSNFKRYIASFGNTGSPTTFTTSQMNATTWIQHVYLGNGGESPFPIFHSSKPFSYYSKNLNDNSIISNMTGATRDFPGGGGGVGASGAQGYVLVFYD
jgi:hypothetical protein